MSVDKITLRLDAAQILPAPTSHAIRQDITIRDTQAQAFKEGVWVEPWQQILMVRPLQTEESAYTSTEIIRHPKAAWTLTDAYWDEVQRDQERWLVNDGTSETITSLAVFPVNAGFLFKFLVMGTQDDLFTALELTFGQWKLNIRSDGLAFLYKSSETFARVSGNLSNGANDKLVGGINELLILPVGDRDLLIRRNGVAGFTYTLPADEGISGAVIESGAFTVKTYTGIRARIELTQLRWPSVLTGYHFVTPNMKFPTAPALAQSVAVELVSEIPGISGGVVASICDPWTAGDDWATIIGRSFVADGAKTDYCVAISLIGDSARNSSPMVKRLVLTADPVDPSAPTDPTDISADVSSLRIKTGDSVLDTVATLTLRDPEDHPIFGACNRYCTIMAGAETIFKGFLAEPPRYAYSREGHNFYECSVQSIAKYLNEQCLPHQMFFDGVDHTQCVRWLCYLAGLTDDNLSLDTDTTPLPDSRTQEADGNVQSKWQPDYADRPMDWIERICEEMGWEFTDGYSEGGEFILKYVDPFSLPTTVDATFYMHSSECTEDYQKVYSWHPYSVEPEANELYVIGNTYEGKKEAGRYWDRQSQDPALTEPADPENPVAGERPLNWLGIRRVAVIEVPFPVTLDWLQARALRIGRELAQRRDIVEFEADWPVGLWKNDVVEVIDSSATKQPRVGKLRILSIDNISFEYEAADVPIRKARYTAVWIGPNG